MGMISSPSSSAATSTSTSSFPVVVVVLCTTFLYSQGITAFGVVSYPTVSRIYQQNDILVPTMKTTIEATTKTKLSVVTNPESSSSSSSVPASVTSSSATIINGTMNIMIPLDVTQQQQNNENENEERFFFTSFLTNRRWKLLDVNGIINAFAIAAAFIGVGILLYHIDSTFPHTIESTTGSRTHVETMKDIVTRIPIEAWDSYESILDESPIKTKALTSATVYTIGDVISQRTEGNSVGNLDRLRILRSLIAGLIGHGPLSHGWYNLLDHIFVDMFHITAWWSFIPKVLVDQASWGPFWNNTYILLIGTMKFDKVENIVSDMKQTTIPLIVNGLKLWIPAHCITYGIIPIENRLLWVDIVEIVWVTILATQAASASTQREGGGGKAMK